MTVLLKPRSGSRRWQHLTTAESLAAPGRNSPVESNYTIILGSHRNTCLKIERDGELCCQVRSRELRSHGRGSTVRCLVAVVPEPN